MADFEQLSDAQRLALGRAAHKLFQNPEVSREAKKLLMKADPTVKFPEIETDDRIDKELKTRDEKIAELTNRQIEAEASARRRALHDQARAKGLKPEDVEDAIVKKGIANWDTAMEYVELSQQAAPATPASYDSTMKMPDTKELWKDPAKWAREQTHAAIDEIQKRRKTG
jgi:hypothetical protein